MPHVGQEMLTLPWGVHDFTRALHNLSVCLWINYSGSFAWISLDCFVVDFSLHPYLCLLVYAVIGGEDVTLIESYHQYNVHVSDRSRHRNEYDTAIYYCGKQIVQLLNNWFGKGEFHHYLIYLIYLIQ